MLECAMVKSVNMVMIIGNLGKEPEIKSRDGGGKIAKFSVATSEEWMNKESGKKFSRTDWHRIAVFNPQLVDIVEQYLKKGSLVYIRGRLRPSSWTTDDGQKRTSVEVEMIDLKMFSRGSESSFESDGQNNWASNTSDNSTSNWGGNDESGSTTSSSDENNDIPF